MGLLVCKDVEETTAATLPYSSENPIDLSLPAVGVSYP